MDIYKIIPSLISKILSILQSANLRNELYTLKDEHEIMWTALTDIKRMSKEENIQKYISTVQELINNRHNGKRKVYRIEG